MEPNRYAIVKSVPVRPTDAARLEMRLGNATNEIRRYAFNLYCGRGKREGHEAEDWKAAECARSAAPLAVVADDEKVVRVTACVADTGNCQLAVEALADEIVIEAEKDGEVLRYTRIPLPVHVDPCRVTAQLRGNELDVVAAREICSGSGVFERTR